MRNPGALAPSFRCDHELWLSGRRTDSKPIAVDVGQAHLSRAPRLLNDLDIELPGERVDISNPDVDGRHRRKWPTGVVVVFREEQSRCSIASDRDERGQRWFEPLLPLLLVAEPLVPRHRLVRVSDVQDGNRLLHAHMLAAQRPPTQPIGNAGTRPARTHGTLKNASAEAPPRR